MPYDETEGGRRSSREHFINDAERRGKDAGASAASWAVPNNATQGWFDKMKQLIDDGDPALDDYISAPAWLSGEWAGESINELIGDIIEEAHDEGYDDIDDDIAEAYEEAASDEFWSEVHRVIEDNAGDNEDDDDAP
jgi:hypothetical protein